MNESRSPSGESSAALAGRSASGSAPQIARRLTPRTPEAGAAFSRGSDRRTECIRKERRFPRRIPLRLERSFALACPSARISACILAAAACALAPSCSEDEIFGDGVGAEAAVTTPSGIQWGKVDIVYTLKHATMTATSVQASYSTNGGVSFLSATEAEGGEGTEDLSVSPDGERHTFVWDSGVDIDQGRFEDLLFRLTPASGKSATSGAFRLHNTVYLAAAHDDAAGVVSLFDLDVTDGDLRSRGSFATGGQSPWDVLFQGGVYYIAHSGSNDVAALGLDEETRLLSPVDGSPFASGGVGTRYLAATGGFLFAANTSGETISIFDIDPATGALALNASSGVQAVGCRSMAARSDFLYVASETAAQIFIFDIEAGGELLPNIYSPIASGGLESPRAMITTPSRLYAANFQTPSICGFSFLVGGGLNAIAGSPFGMTDAGAEQIARLSLRLFVAGGAAGSLSAMTADIWGEVVEDAGSPYALSGPASTVAAAGDAVVAGTTTSETLEVFLIGSEGDLTPTPASPHSAPAPIARLAVSD